MHYYEIRSENKRILEIEVNWNVSILNLKNNKFENNWLIH